MNFLGRMDGPEIEVELKYCERCGGLWLSCPFGSDAKRGGGTAPKRPPAQSWCAGSEGSERKPSEPGPD